MATSATSRPITSVLTKVVSDVAYLLQTEIRLARAELDERVSEAMRSGKFIGAGAILLLAGLIVLLLAAARWLTAAGLAEEWSLTLIGGAAFIAGLVLAMRGRRGFHGAALKPQRTLDQLRKDVAIIKEQSR